MNDFVRCSSGRRVLLKNTPPGLARDNFSTAGLVSSGHPLPGEVAFFQDAQDAIDYVRTHDAIQRIRDLHREQPVYAYESLCPDRKDYHHRETRHFETADGEWVCADMATGETICAECSRIPEGDYPYYGEYGLTNVLYPCLTIRALDGERG
ncbi:MAG: hypothetical protein ACTH9H_13135 [Galactobacter sp.]